MSAKLQTFDSCVTYLISIFDKGGPLVSDYEEVTQTCQFLNGINLSMNQEMDLYNFIKPIYKINNMIGYTYLKPHGYAGDFEQIHKIYNEWKCEETTEFHNWDNYYHNLSASKAVKNRKQYIQAALSKIECNHSPIVLNLGSGPCTDIKEYLKSNPKSNIRFVCLDMDEKAIAFGKNECKEYLDQIDFISANAFKYRTDQRFDLIWSAGMFDYFKDKLFVRLIRNYYHFIKKGGQLVVGNFAEKNDSRGAMELFGQWYLHHRSPEHLIQLAMMGDVEEENISIKSEEMGVNLFMHIVK